MLGSDRHICLVTNINDYSSYHKRARDRGLHQEKQSFRYCDLTWQIKNRQSTMSSTIEEGYSAYDYYNRYKVNKKRFGRIKNKTYAIRKRFFIKSFRTRLELMMSLKELIRIWLLVL